MPEAPTRESGCIQTATPSQRIESYQTDGNGTSETVRDVQLAVKDPASPQAIPDIPTTEAPYDGQVAFGVFITDQGLDG